MRNSAAPNAAEESAQPSSRLCENADELKIGGNLVQVHAGILSFSAKTRF